MALDVQTHHHQPHFHVNGARGGASHGSSLATLHQAIPITLDLLHNIDNLSSPHIELENPSPLPSGWQKFLDIKTGEIYYKKNTENMSRRNISLPKLDLKLNLSPPRVNPRVEASPSRSATVSPTSPPSSCVSSEMNQDDILRYSNSPEATSMVLVGCPRCLMYVMLSEDDPKCPKCKSTVLLDFLHDNNNSTTTSTTTNTRKTRRS